MTAPTTGDWELRLVGRGGQGVVTAGDLLGRAAVGEGRWAQSIPTFGPERRGALAQSTLRIADEPILLKCSRSRPRVVVVIDPTIWHHANVLLGLEPEATLVFNTRQAPGEVAAELCDGRWGYRLEGTGHSVCTVDATGIANQVLGHAIPNTAMVGALVGATGLVGMAAVHEALVARFGARAEANQEAAKRAADALVRAEV